MSEENDAIFVETSALTAENVEELFVEISKFSFKLLFPVCMATHIHRSKTTTIQTRYGGHHTSREPGGCKERSLKWLLRKEVVIPLCLYVPNSKTLLMCFAWTSPILHK